MKITSIAIRNFRRLEQVAIGLEEGETVFVGPNNSGKTSAAAAFRCFLGGKDFRVHDLSVSKISAIDAFGEGGEAEDLPTIELDLWFSIDPSHISFGRAFTLLPELSDELDKVGIRLKYQPCDPKKMHAEYCAAYPELEVDGKRARTLSQYLGIDNNLKQHYEIAYYSLDDCGQEILETLLDSKEGKSLLRDLLRVDFVDAQRSVNDDEASRSSRLSTAFSSFYKKNLEQAEAKETAYQVIDENNKKLTDHYETHFSGLMEVIKGLGVPSINDRILKIVSSLSPEEALQGNTDLIYIDEARQHELPESYNGLGFKNLIYMAIQISHFHLQWMRTEQNRPLCQLIFIEEPEVHLHAQVQQTFIGNIWKIISNAARAEKQADLVPQFVVSTHSSHILETVDFAKVRYFERCELEGEDRQTVRTFNASRVHSLRSFDPGPVDVGGRQVDPEKAKRFLLRYLKLTHCDLFFADAAILVEGTVEKLLLPKMIEKTAPTLHSKYISILEVGGAYAHRFEGLLSFLNIPHLVITDLDSVAPEGRHPARRGDYPHALTSNASLKKLFNVNTVQELLTLTPKQKQDEEKDRCVAFQVGINVEESSQTLTMIPRTIEESFAYDNFALLRSGAVDVGIDVPADLEGAYQAIFEIVKSSSFKKTDFALDVLASEVDWITPVYIEEGLSWLAQRLEKVELEKPLADN
ncbi:ATP-dependent nuclease [Halomonas piscis]|uniref:ATP-dependent nuclease n=1 Tax=Halomonas piscis TaxID=3031727 RepID=UPI0028968514|nr:AAA family ATPase [Halomonas piscis]